MRSRASLGSRINIRLSLLKIEPDMTNFLLRKAEVVLSVDAHRVVGGWTWTTTIREW